MAYRKVHMLEIKEILLRIARGQSKRKIRKDLKIHGITINRYLDIAKSLGIDPIESGPDDITDDLCYAIKAKVHNLKGKEPPPRDKLLLPVKDEIEDYLKQGITKTKIITLLARDGIVVTESSFYRFVKSHLNSYLRSGITVRLPETEPGKYAQADFGRLGKIWDSQTGRYRIAWAFIITLTYSRHMYVYITFSQDTRSVISGCEEAWGYFGGIPVIVIFDNLSPVIDKADRYNPRINKTFLEYAQRRGFVIDPTNPGHPKGKPHVEKMVSYVKKNFFSGESFISLQDSRERAIEWCSNIAGKRIHGTTREVPIEVFENKESRCLSHYDGSRYDTPYWAICKVHPDHHIQFRKSLYSLPTRFIGKSVEVRGDSALVRIYFEGKLAKTHPRVEVGKRSTDYDDYPDELTPYTLRNARYQINEGSKRHPVIGQYIEFMLSGPYPWHRIRSVQRLLRISDKYGADRTAAACARAKAYSIYDIRRIEKILKNGMEYKDRKEEDVQVFQGKLRFLRSSDSFVNYK